MHCGGALTPFKSRFSRNHFFLRENLQFARHVIWTFACKSCSRIANRALVNPGLLKLERNRSFTCDWSTSHHAFLPFRSFNPRVRPRPEKRWKYRRGQSARTKFLNCKIEKQVCDKKKKYKVGKMEEATGTSKGFNKRTHTAKTRETAGKLDTTLLNSTISRNATTRNRNTLNDTRALKVPGRKIASSRQSIIPSQLPVDIQKKIDDEKKEMELGLLYDEYLQAMMTDLIVRKMTEEKKKLMVAQLATLAQEMDRDTEKLIKITRRERDITSLSSVQKEIDEQLAAVTKCTKNQTFRSLKDVLSKLQTLLEPLNVLRCNGMILPQTEDEWKDTQEVLARCSNTLKSITEVIGSDGETLCAVNTELKSLTETYNEIEIIQKKMEKALCHLQVVMLKNASLSLTRDEDL